MIESPPLGIDFPLATAGDIALANLESARLQSWSRFWESPKREGIAEYIVEQEQMVLQFVSDAEALDRLNSLVEHLIRVDSESMRTALIQAQVASTAHRFADARRYLQQAEVRGPLPVAAHRLLLSIAQACGDQLEAVLETRRKMAEESRRLEDLVPLGALLADLRHFNEADRTYQRALGEYKDVSPFALAWVCFQRGVLWGELVPEARSGRAAHWYRRAIEYLPCYVKARVHLAEICLHNDQLEDAEELLLLAVSSGDPEVNWRLADVMIAGSNFAEGKAYLQAARSGFEALLEKHLLAFADHGAEFYSGSGHNPGRALELASVNLVNRPTLRAFEQTYETALGAGQLGLASAILAAAEERWGATFAFGLSPFAVSGTNSEEAGAQTPHC